MEKIFCVWRKIHLKIKILYFIFLVCFSYCGMNVDVPSLPVALDYPVAVKPSIVSLRFEESDDAENQFIIEYYVNNSESQFVGYNLYISTVPSAFGNIQIKEKKNIYLEYGIEPSFSHNRALENSLNSSLDSQEIVSKRIPHYKAPPVPENFYSCLVYYFRLTAYLRGGFESEASDEVEGCAANNASSCPLAKPCNP